MKLNKKDIEYILDEIALDLNNPYGYSETLEQVITDPKEKWVFSYLLKIKE